MSKTKRTAYEVHLRNHGFIREPSGWRLSPAFDMNPSLAKAEHALTLERAPHRHWTMPCQPQSCIG